MIHNVTRLLRMILILIRNKLLNIFGFTFANKRNNLYTDIHIFFSVFTTLFAYEIVRKLNSLHGFIIDNISVIRFN